MRLAELRTRYTRVQPTELAAAMATGALVVDTRPVEQRRRDGALPGAWVVDRNVLEWRLDPTSPHRIAPATHETRIILVCNEGYSSTLAAASLQRLGLSHATDLVDGYQGLVAAGLLEPLRDRAPRPSAATGAATGTSTGTSTGTEVR